MHRFCLLLLAASACAYLLWLGLIYFEVCSCIFHNLREKIYSNLLSSLAFSPFWIGLFPDSYVDKELHVSLFLTWMEQWLDGIIGNTGDSPTISSWNGCCEEDLFLLRSILEEAEKWMRLNCDTYSIHWLYLYSNTEYKLWGESGGARLTLTWAPLITGYVKYWDADEDWSAWMQLGLSLKSFAWDLCCFSALTSFYLSTPKIQSATSSAYIRVTFSVIYCSRHMYSCTYHMVLFPCVCCETPVEQIYRMKTPTLSPHVLSTLEEWGIACLMDSSISYHKKFVPV